MFKFFKQGNQRHKSWFGFCVALISYMIVSVIKAALSSIHGAKIIEEQVSGYYLADARLIASRKK
jgi:hypothetical protein